MAIRQNRTETVLKNRFRFRSGSGFFRFRELDFETLVFTQTLRTQFGPLDPTADAEDNLDNLKMYDNQHILKYNINFNHLSIQTGWTDGVLRHRYYSGLAERIKDIMVQQDKPSTLKEMKTLAHAIDA